MDEMEVALKSNRGKVFLRKPSDLFGVISRFKNAFIIMHQIAYHEHGMILTGGCRTNTQQEGIIGFKAGFLCQFAKGTFVRGFPQFDKPAGQAPLPLLGFDAAFHQQKLPLGIMNHEAGGWNRIFVNGPVT